MKKSYTLKELTELCRKDPKILDELPALYRNFMLGLIDEKLGKPSRVQKPERVAPAQAK